MLFSKETYMARRQALSQRIKSGLIILMGNNLSPVNYPANAYRFRQDSSFLYYFGQHREGLVGVIDTDENKEWLIGNDIDIEDIVWFGSVDSVADMAAQSGVANSAPMAKLKGCAKGVWLYGCISLLLFWWQQAGLLDSKAAVPSFIVLALLAGVQIGSACRE